MKQIRLIAVAITLLASSPSFGQQAGHTDGKALQSAPSDSMTVTEYYKQNVYDRSDKKIGRVADVLIGKQGQINALVIGAGGFLGMGRHDVLVPFSAVQMTKKNGKNYLVMDATKDDLKNVPGFRYDRSAMTWKPDEDRQTTGSANDKRRNRSNR
jgi:sporulation protein YlmC with PRC-barrel domain